MAAFLPSLTELRGLDDLQSRLGYAFKDEALLRRALTHASANARASNERLEFFGDRVLGLIVAEKLFQLYPGDAEGALALKYNALARREACAAAAEAAGVSEYLFLASAEAASGGRRKGAILAGACEAIIAALYLDGGYDVARNFVERYWQDAFAALGQDMRDAKTMLQEWAQAQPSRAAPVYRLVKREGPDHAPQFFVEVKVADETPHVGEGRSKREAEQAAAQAMLARLGRA